jgi:demethylmenaquinone methyltransferase/2-methoxy-6-polyprenyl-1,4-benzoquinol methylase
MNIKKLLLSTGVLGAGVAAVALRRQTGRLVETSSIDQPTTDASTLRQAQGTAGLSTSLETIRTTYRIWAPIYEWGTGPLLLGQESRLRRKAVAALNLKPGDTVLDLACGTGKNFPLLQAAIGPAGRIIGFDFTPEMLAVAEERVARQGWNNVTLIQGDAAALALDEPFDPSTSSGRHWAQGRPVDAVLCTLGITVIPRWHAAIRRAVAVLKPGGTLVIGDARLSDRPGMGPVNGVIDRLGRKLAAADLRRRPWEFMVTVLNDVELENFFFDLGFVAQGHKPDSVLSPSVTHSVQAY